LTRNPFKLSKFLYNLPYNKTMKELKKVLGKEEKIIWQGKPNFWPFVLKSFILTIFGIFWMGFLSIFFLIFGPWIIILPHFWIGLFLIFGGPLYSFLVYKYVWYVITDKRIIIQRGLVGRDFTSIDYDKITDVDVIVGIADKLFGGKEGSGSINIYTPASFRMGSNGSYIKPNSLANIPNPYGVFQKFKKLAHDVKTDISFPNMYRPGVNPGYGTQYKPKELKRSRKTKATKKKRN